MCNHHLFTVAALCRLLVKRKCYETAAVAAAAAASSLNPRRASLRLFSSFSVGEWVSISWFKHVSVFVVEEIFEGSRVGECFQLGVLKAHFGVPGYGFQGASVLG